MKKHVELYYKFYVVHNIAILEDPQTLKFGAT